MFLSCLVRAETLLEYDKGLSALAHILVKLFINFGDMLVSRLIPIRDCS